MRFKTVATRVVDRSKFVVRRLKIGEVQVKCLFEEHLACTLLCACNMLFKYGGVPRFTALKQSAAVFNSIRLRTGNQRSECSRSELDA